MTGDIAAAAGGCHIFSGCGYPAPGLHDFYFQKLFSIGGWNVTKPELIAILCVIIIVAFFWVGVRQAEDDSRQDAEHRRDGRLGRARPGRPPGARQAGRHVHAVPGAAVLLDLRDEPDGAHPGAPVPVDVADRVRLAAGARGVRPLLVPGLQDQGVHRLLQVLDPGGAVVDPDHLDPGRDPQVRLHPAVHPRASGCSRTCSPATCCCRSSWSRPGTWRACRSACCTPPGSLFMVFFVFLLELLVDLLQAFIFTTLTATYIADSLESGH